MLGYRTRYVLRGYLIVMVILMGLYYYQINS